MELKDVFDFLGIEGEVTSKEQLAQIFNSTYVPIAKAGDNPDVRKAVEGRLFGEAYGQLAKATGGKLTKEQLASKKFGEALEEVVNTWTAELETTKAKAQEGKAKREADLEKELEDHKKSLTDYQKQLLAREAEVQNMQANYEQELGNYVLGIERAKVEAELPWSETVDALKREGFNTLLQREYQFIPDKSGKVTVKDKTGSIVFSKAKASEPMGLKELYTLVGEQHNMFKKNNAGASRPEPSRQQEQHTGPVSRRLPVQPAPRG